MDAILWIVLPVLVAAGSAILSFYVMHSRMEVAVAKEREALAEANAKFRALESGIPDKTPSRGRDREAQCLRRFPHGFSRGGTQIPAREQIALYESAIDGDAGTPVFPKHSLSNWVEHEMPLNSGAEAELLEKASVFSAQALSDYSKRQPVPKYLAQ